MNDIFQAIHDNFQRELSGKTDQNTAPKSILTYPEELAGKDTWIKFKHLTTLTSATTTDKKHSVNADTGQTDSTVAANGTKTPEAGSIYLYHPDMLVSNQIVQWQEEETGVFGMSGIQDMVKGNFSLESLQKAATMDNAKAIAQRVAIASLPGRIYSHGKGQTVNPNMMMFFRNINFREHSFSFSFAPKSGAEVKNVIEIIRTFKRFSVPASTGGAFLPYPSKWTVETRSRGKQYTMFKTCVITSVSVNATPNSIWATFENGFPVDVSIELTMREIEQISGQDYVDNVDGWY